jgi:virginiamycin B lyase
MVLLPLVLLSGAAACGRAVEGETSGRVAEPLSSNVTGGPGSSFVPAPPAAPAPSGAFGPMQVAPQREQATVSPSSGGSCWASPPLAEYTLAKGGGSPTSVAAAPDGSVWFSEAGAVPAIGRLDLTGAVTRYPLPPGRTPGPLAVGPDGSVWFGTTGPAVGHLTPSGRLVGYATPTVEGPIHGPGPTPPGPFVAGPDGAMWFAEMAGDNVGRITPDGTITEYPLPSRDRMHANPEGIAIGSDGAIWFSETLLQRMGRIDVHTHAITEFPIPPYPDGVAPATVAAGPDGAIWFDGGEIGRMTTNGDYSKFALPWQGQYAPTSATAGPDGRLWMIDTRNGKVLRMTLQGAVSEAAPVADPKGLYNGGLDQLSAGPDDVWFAEPAVNRIGRYGCRPAV